MQRYIAADEDLADNTCVAPNMCSVIYAKKKETN